MSVADLNLEREGEKLTIQVSGEWTLRTFTECRAVCKAGTDSQDFKNIKKIILDGCKLEQLDTAGSKELSDFIFKISSSSFLQEQDFVNINFSIEKKLLFELVFSRLQKYYSLPVLKNDRKDALFHMIGAVSMRAIQYLNELFNFFGLVADSVFKLIIRPSLFRPKELITQMEEACLKSIPVISLVTFLIGVVVTYLMAMQVEKYGGHIYVVKGVALAMCREFSPVIVAVVMAGRSGSAYTAQIGAMRLNEEVDAITSMGLSVQQVLVLPRVFALILSMPLLVFIGDMAGIFGGLVIAESYLGLSYTTFIERLQISLPIKHFVVGMIKAPVFASIIAIIGCRRGLNTEMNARSVGLSTTATVVESIVLVILLNAAFAVIFANLGI